MNDINVGERYDFITLAPVTLGSVYKNMLAVEVMMAKKAVTLSDVSTTNARVSQELSLQTIPNIDDMIFVLFETESGENILFSKHWIDNNTVELTQRVNRTIQIDDVDLAMLPIIQQALRAIGVTKFEVK